MRPQPPKLPDDGAVTVGYVKDHPLGRRRELVRLVAETGGAEQTIVCSEHNAYRLFGMLALILGIELPKKIAKQIKLGEVTAKFTGPPPAGTALPPVIEKALGIGFTMVEGPLPELTEPQKRELEKLRSGPQTTFGAPRVRVQKRLVELGLAEFTSDGDFCQITERGRGAEEGDNDG